MPKFRTYTRNLLAKRNPVYLSDYAHEITLKDVNFANQCVRIMFERLSSTGPQIGDVIQYTAKDGTYYGNAHIDRIDNGIASICLIPFVPFIEKETANTLYFHSVSGGPWVSVPVDQLHYLGTANKDVCFFGSSGVCAHGSITFTGYAKCWEFKEEGLLFGNFSTKEYHRVVLHKYGKKWHLCECHDPEDFPQRTEDIPAWIKERHGIQFGDFQHGNAVTIFTYREIPHFIPQKKWMKLALPQGTRYMNHSNVYVKLAVDHEKKTIDVYRYANH